MLRFDHSGRFTVLQVSDAQDMHYPRKTMLRMLDRAYDRVRPDLVIFTGDNVLGNHLRDAVFGTREVVHTQEEEYRRLRKSLAAILDPVAKRRIPFTYIYGNHDDLGTFPKSVSNEIYASYPNLVGPENREPGMEEGTFFVPIMSHDGKKTAFNLWCFDSCRQLPDGTTLSAVTRECLDWYIRKSAELKAANGGESVPSLIFQHIPMKEQAELITGGDAYTVGSVKFPGTDFVRLDPKKASGTLGEPISAVDEDYGEADAIRQCGDCLAVVTGHDHCNSFDGVSNGIRHIQTAAASFRCYGTRDRGVRVFELNETQPEKFVTYTLTYADLCGDGPLAELAYIWDADGQQKKKAALIAGTAATAIACAGITVNSIIKKHHGGK